MIRIGNLPVRTRLPVTAWVLAGLVALFSLIQTNVELGDSTPLAAQTTGPSKAAYDADLIGVVGPVTPSFLRSPASPSR
jgi:hypothetical protein